MPEIAEVETVRNILKKQILFKKIINVNIIYPKMIESDLVEFKNVLIGNKFIDIKRIGKWLLFELEKHYLVSHLRMEGKFNLKQSNEEIIRHEHVIISFEGNLDLRYNDTRKFGRMNLIKKEELYNIPAIKNQGIEPLDKNLNSDYLLDKFKNKKTPIKTVLLDQTIISGLGNIYANEVLYAAKINPLKPAGSLTKAECDELVKSSRKIIKKAIAMGGTTINSYTSALGITGHYQDELKVHKKESNECPLCHHKIKREKVNGRSTYYCEHCQK